MKTFKELFSESKKDIFLDGNKLEWNTNKTDEE